MVSDAFVGDAVMMGFVRAEGDGTHPSRKNTHGQEGFRRHRADPKMARVRRARAR